MVPIYESDVAEERWNKSRWNHYELWEKVEQRVRRHNRLWIAATVAVFLLLSSIPILSDRMPKWRGLSAVRTLGQQINQLKRQAGVEHKAFRIRFAGGGSLSYQVESVPSCAENAPATVVSSGALLPSRASEYVLLSKAQGAELQIPGLAEEYCYDPLTGSAPLVRGESVVGFGLIPVSDLTSDRMDRLSVLLISGASGDLSFE